MLILAVIFTALAATCVVTAGVSAVVELALRNYGNSIVASLAVLTGVPLVFIGQNLITMATSLVAVSP